MLTDEQLQTVKSLDTDSYKAITLPILFDATKKGDLSASCDRIFEAADLAISEGYNIIVLSDRMFGKNYAPIPALLVSAGLIIILSAVVRA